MRQEIIYFLAGVVLVFCGEINVENAFKDNEVSPDVISKAPQKLVGVKYTKSGKDVNLGNELAPKDVKDAPDVHFDGDEASYYTLIMTDPDAPNRQKPVSREWGHWLVVNIPGAKVSNGDVLSEYVGSGPPKDTGLHRYVFLVYKQSGKLTFDEAHHSRTDGKRGKFSTDKFAKKYNLGEPVAGNFFQAQYDDSVPDLHRQLVF